MTFEARASAYIPDQIIHLEKYLFDRAKTFFVRDKCVKALFILIFIPWH